MKSKNDAISVLFEDIEEEVLERMPEWFKVLKKGHEKRANRL